MISDTHSPIGKLVLTGGTLDVSNLGNYGQWGNTAFRGGVEVHPSEIPSRIKVGKFIHLNHLNPDCVFNVDQGATLFVDGPLVDGYEKDSWKLIHCRLIKRGAGTLVLNGKNTFSGGLVLEAGTIKTGNRLALGTAPCDIRENSTLLVPAMAEASLPGLTENSVLTQTGDGVLCFDGNLPSAAQVNISEGIAEFPSLDTIPSFVFFSPSTFLALQDFQQNWQSAMTAYPNIAGVLSAQKNVTVDQIAFDPQKEHWAVGALEDCTLEIGSVSGIQNLDVVGTGITKIGSLSGTDAVTVKKGAFAYLPENSPISSAGEGYLCQNGSANAVAPIVKLTEDPYVFYVPDGMILKLEKLERDPTRPDLSHIRKVGGGTLVLPDGDLSGTYQNLYLDEGTVSIEGEQSFGTGEVFLKGELEVRKSTQLLRTRVVCERKTAAIRVLEGCTFEISHRKWITNESGFTKKGMGCLKAAYSNSDDGFKSIGDSHWTIEEGELFIEKSDMFGGHDAINNIVVEVKERAVLRANLHTPFNHLILEGGTLEGFGNDYFHGEGPIEEYTGWQAFALNGIVEVRRSPSGKESVIRAPGIHLAHVDRTTLFDVAEGAVLNLDCVVYPGRISFEQMKEKEDFEKIGKGTLRLLKPCNFSGQIFVQEGTLAIGKDVDIPPETKINVQANAKLRLEDGARISTPVETDHPLLGSADVWVDAASYQGTQSQEEVSEIPNKGTAGGVFTQFTNWNIPEKPKWEMNGINDLPVFTFDGSQALKLDSYKNTTDHLTVFLVAKWTSWEDAPGKGKWGSPISLSTVKANNSDHAVLGTFHYEHALGCEVTSVPLSGAIDKTSPPQFIINWYSI